MSIAAALLPFVLQFANAALPGGKTFTCVDPASGSVAISVEGVRKAKQVTADVWLLTFTGSRREALQVDPSLTCKVTK